MMIKNAASVSEEEVARFSAQADQWWNPRGSFRALHALGPVRMDYIRQQMPVPLKGLRVLDAGCGGGLLAESMAREGARVVGIDASFDAIKVAQAHAKVEGLGIDYRQETVESLAQTDERFDLITAFEIVEHVANLKSFMTALATLLKPGGVIMVATLNRTKRSFLLGVVMAEYVLGWVPPGTHDWDRFVRPSEMVNLWASLGIEAMDCTGLVYKPMQGAFVLSKGRAGVNYFMAGCKGKMHPKP
ncbi:MAG: bifunctional 2-polyprenyl-6-hydroxyphenol methylase/3-demethylubiquinol 3-O-methyltransferase UbiG [Bdellovibrionales bacterium]